MRMKSTDRHNMERHYCFLAPLAGVAHPAGERRQQDQGPAAVVFACPGAQGLVHLGT